MQEYKPRVPDETFTAADDEEEELPPRGLPLQELAKCTSAERLEAAVVSGVRVLNDMQKPLESLTGSADAQSWLEQIQRVRELAIKTKTVVGVVGNTGAGKSSFINAMLDEERLVPTNCMRACTAVVTELSYNESNNEHSRYRAEIEFIRPEDWQKELDILFADVFDEDGKIARDASNPDTQAGIAYAKIRAVYNKYTKDDLAVAIVRSLMQVKQVRAVLGTTKRLNSADPSEFYRRLQGYVDSKEKGTEQKDKNGNKITNPKREFECWPLIKCVKIYTKADALSTGAVIVDLPGVHDSNAARAAVAESYMKQCTGLWIVAPINRAVDDKAAKTLLGNTFKRQLKYDGTYSAVTFICSKTDDISKTEATDRLELGEQMESLDARLYEIDKQRRALKSEVKDLKAERTNCTDVAERADEDIEVWESLSEKVDDGKTVYAPVAKRKRKRVSRKPTSRKKRTSSNDSDEVVEYIDSDSDSEEAESDDGYASPQTDPLTRERIDLKLDELKQQKRDARKERSTIDDRIKELQAQLVPLNEEVEDIDAQQNSLVIAGRNEYSRSAIRKDFADGIRELDQENAEEEDPDSFNPEEDLRDYDQVARDLPVFCVSSRAYQELNGRFQKDNDVPGFTDAAQTEIPKLQAHCKKLTENGRQATCRRFLNSLTQFLTSMGLWATDDGSGRKMTEQQRSAEHRFLEQRLKELQRALEKAVTENLKDVEDTLNDQIFEKFGPAVDAASENALATSTGWGAPKDQGGLYWASYKATVKRDGVFQSAAAGLRDFNADLAEPLYKQLASSWEKAFQRRLPTVFNSFARSGADLLRKFHQAVADRGRQKGHSLAKLGLLENSLQAYQAIFKDVATAMINMVNEGQRDINREVRGFAP